MCGYEEGDLVTSIVVVHRTIDEHIDDFDAIGIG